MLTEIIEDIIVFAHKLGMKVIAEGVETEAQLDKLKLLGCKQIQKYFLKLLAVNGGSRQGTTSP